ncbi:hypothetical protein [Streptomyces sp. NPDC088746]|uniref:hypothetical protein n=1 Tax=Streptomyces sp. NPDC088746 TaxID=3365885 RepID=UPI0038018AF6
MSAQGLRFSTWSLTKLAAFLVTEGVVDDSQLLTQLRLATAGLPRALCAIAPRTGQVRGMPRVLAVRLAR